MEVRLRHPVVSRVSTLPVFGALILLGMSPALHAAESTATAKPSVSSSASSSVPAPELAKLAVWRLPAPASTASQAEIDLGRQLFFDPRLTGDDATSCAQCHIPGLDWADGRPRPMPQQLTLGRNTIALVNVGYRKSFFWDGRATSLEAAISSHMAENEGASDHAGDPGIVAGIASLDGYRREFEAVFHTDTITTDQISQALAAFLRTLVVRDTPFDRWIGGDGKAISEEAKQGFALFTGKADCVHCHTPPYFSDFKFHNTGVNSIDPGHYEVTGKSDDRSAFRTPDLRQVGRTAPYMHNGSMPTLEDVIDFYNKGGDTLDPDNELKPLGLTDTEQHNLVIFLYSLTNQNPPTAQFPVLPASGESPPAPDDTIH